MNHITADHETPFDAITVYPRKTITTRYYLPSGYRLLEHGEVIKNSDMTCMNAEQHPDRWSSVVGSGFTVGTAWYLGEVAVVRPL